MACELPGGPVWTVHRRILLLRPLVRHSCEPDQTCLLNAGCICRRVAAAGTAWGVIQECCARLRGSQVYREDAAGERVLPATPNCLALFGLNGTTGFRQDGPAVDDTTSKAVMSALISPGSQAIACRICGR